MANVIIESYKEIIVKPINLSGYPTKQDVLRLIKYITGNSTVIEHQKTVRYIGAFGVSAYNPVLCCNTMYVVKRLYGKASNKFRRIYHFMISFPTGIEDANTVKFIAINLCEKFYDQGFQCIYGVHEDTDNLHIHMAINSTNFITGKQLHISSVKSIKTDLKKMAFKILKDNGY